MSEELELEGKFKTAAELGLSKKQYCGLVQTLAWLEAGKLDHENEKTCGFDMKSWGGIQYMNGRGHCGTVCCIGGTAEALSGVSLNMGAIGLATHYKELGRLFFPGSAYGWSMETSDSHSGWRASTAQAAVALRGYLETGRADWDAAMKTPRKRRKRRK